MTALPIIKLTETPPAPSTHLKAFSTAEVHAPHVIPSTLTVVVAICDVDRAEEALASPAAKVLGTTIVSTQAKAGKCCSHRIRASSRTSEGEKKKKRKEKRWPRKGAEAESD